MNLTLRALAHVFLCGCAAAQSAYTLTAIASPVPAAAMYPAALDQDSNVLLRLSFASPSTPAQLWITGPAGARQLALLSSPQPAYASKLSDFGRVLGTMSGRPTVWDATGQPRFLRPLPYLAKSDVLAGNSAGWLVGVAYDTGGYEGGSALPLLWIHDVLVPLDAPLGAVSAACNDINEHGRIVGIAVYHPTQHNVRGMGWVRDGLQAPIGIGWPAGHQSNLLHAVNNAGEAVGTIVQSGGGYAGLRWKDGVFTSVVSTQELNGIARDGTAIGTFYGGGAGDQPTISIGAQAWLLQDLLDPVSAAGWDLFSAVDINDSGMVLCQAFDPAGVQRPCLLTPILGVHAPGVPRRERTSQQHAQVAAQRKPSWAQRDRQGR